MPNLLDTGLDLAVYAARPEIVKLLLDAGADPTTKSFDTKYYPGRTPAQIAKTLAPDARQAILTRLQS